MWKPSTTPDKPSAPAPENERPRASISPIAPDPIARVAGSGTQASAIIGKSIVIKGEVTGSESLHIEGRVEGAVNMGDNYVHIGPGATVISNVTARELVIRGTLKGNPTLTDRLDIRSGGSLDGNVVAKRVSIEDGAYFKGSIDMRPKATEDGARSHANGGAKKEQAMPVLAGMAHSDSVSGD